MKLSEIQGNLRSILEDMDILADLVDEVITVDRGQDNSAIEASLLKNGLSIIVMDPQATGIDDAGRGAVRLVYSTTIWVRTNPHSNLPDATEAGEEFTPRWDPFVLEEKILSAVLAWSGARSDYGFVIPPGLEPETDWADVGSHSRLIRFATHINFK